MKCFTALFLLTLSNVGDAASSDLIADRSVQFQFELWDSAGRNATSRGTTDLLIQSVFLLSFHFLVVL